MDYSIANNVIGRLHHLLYIGNDFIDKESHILFLKSDEFLNCFSTFNDLKEFLDTECKNILIYAVGTFSKNSIYGQFSLKEIHNDESFLYAKSHDYLVISGIILNDIDDTARPIITTIPNDTVFYDKDNIKTIIPNRVSIKSYNDSFEV